MLGATATGLGELIVSGPVRVTADSDTFAEALSIIVGDKVHLIMKSDFSRVSREAHPVRAMFYSCTKV